MSLIIFVLPFTAVTNPRPVREAAERILPRACCACSHQLQNSLRGLAPNKAGVGHDQHQSVCATVVDADVIAFVIVLSVAIVDVGIAIGDSSAVVAVAVVVVGAIVDIGIAIGDSTAVVAVAVVAALLLLLEVIVDSRARRKSKKDKVKKSSRSLCTQVFLVSPKDRKRKGLQ